MLSGLVALSLLSSVLFAPSQAQLTGSVGPLTTLASKSKICNVLDYGGSIGSSDIGPAILSAFNVGAPSVCLDDLLITFVSRAVFLPTAALPFTSPQV